MLANETREKCTVTLFRTAAEDALIHRVRSEFSEMPGMRLTEDQAMKLWSIDRTTCRDLLDSMVAQHFLALDRNGRYRRVYGGY